MIFNTSGGGGAALNFRVVGNPQPSNPKENCIWVDTDTPITSWIFSATEPSPAEAGMVWIAVGTSSPVEFNALKKNGIQVYPNSAKQYVDGAWVDVTAKIYQGGKWVEFVFNLFPPLNGWEFCNFTSGYSLGTCTFDDNAFVASVANKQTAGICKKIDLTEIDTITIDFTTTLKSTTYGGILISIRDSVVTSNPISNVRASDAELLVGTISVDTSAISGVHFVVAGGDCWSSSGAFTFEIHSVRGLAK